MLETACKSHTAALTTSSFTQPHILGRVLPVGSYLILMILSGSTHIIFLPEMRKVRLLEGKDVAHNLDVTEVGFECRST